MFDVFDDNWIPNLPCLIDPQNEAQWSHFGAQRYPHISPSPVTQLQKLNCVDNAVHNVDFSSIPYTN